MGCERGSACGNCPERFTCADSDFTIDTLLKSPDIFDQSQDRGDYMSPDFDPMSALISGQSPDTIALKTDHELKLDISDSKPLGLCAQALCGTCPLFEQCKGSKLSVKDVLATRVDYDKPVVHTVRIPATPRPVFRAKVETPKPVPIPTVAAEEPVITAETESLVNTIDIPAPIITHPFSTPVYRPYIPSPVVAAPLEISAVPAAVKVQEIQTAPAQNEATIVIPIPEVFKKEPAQTWEQPPFVPGILASPHLEAPSPSVAQMPLPKAEQQVVVQKKVKSRTTRVPLVSAEAKASAPPPEVTPVHAQEPIKDIQARTENPQKTIVELLPAAPEELTVAPQNPEPRKKEVIIAATATEENSITVNQTDEIAKPLIHPDLPVAMPMPVHDIQTVAAVETKKHTSEAVVEIQEVQIIDDPNSMLERIVVTDSTERQPIHTPDSVRTDTDLKVIEDFQVSVEVPAFEISNEEPPIPPELEDERELEASTRIEIPPPLEGAVAEVVEDSSLNIELTPVNESPAVIEDIPAESAFEEDPEIIMENILNVPVDVIEDEPPQEMQSGTLFVIEQNVDEIGYAVAVSDDVPEQPKLEQPDEVTISIETAAETEEQDTHTTETASVPVTERTTLDAPQETIFISTAPEEAFESVDTPDEMTTQTGIVQNETVTIFTRTESAPVSAEVVVVEKTESTEESEIAEVKVIESQELILVSLFQLLFLLVMFNSEQEEDIAEVSPENRVLEHDIPQTHNWKEKRLLGNHTRGTTFTQNSSSQVLIVQICISLLYLATKNGRPFDLPFHNPNDHQLLGIN